MLLEFTVENFRSFYEKKTLVMEADSGIMEHNENLFDSKNKEYKLLRSIVLYGANSSGKSNLVLAMNAMRHSVLDSVNLNNNDEMKYYDPFLLLKGNDRPTMFEVVFLKEKYCFRYGFSYNRERIVDEWLFRKTTPRSKEKMLFCRDEKEIRFKERDFPEGIGLKEKTNDNRLFLSLCQQLGGKTSRQVISWFQKDFNLISGLNSEQYRLLSRLLFHKKEKTSIEAQSFFQKLRLEFKAIYTHEENPRIPRGLPDELKPFFQKQKSIELYSVHNIYDQQGNIVDQLNFLFDQRESSGTNKLFDLSGPLFETLHNGSVLAIDELDAKMHPILSKSIVDLFNNPETNPNNAQLIFTTHNTNLLSRNIFRRDQIWFTEKNEKEQTDLYCLIDFVFPNGTKVRNDANYEKNYIAGRYGAIPYILNE